jgi:pyridoxal phosphate enzyme (YggS family)
MDIQLIDNFRRITSQIAEAKIRYRKADDIVRFMAVTKTVPAEVINEAISLGIDLLGENRVQEYLSKKDSYSKAEVHFIGSLQSNKVRKIADSVTLIHSLDSSVLADEINRQAENAGRVLDVLIELNIGNQDSKSGVSEQTFMPLAEYTDNLPALRLRGIMVIPPPGKSDLYFGKTQEFFLQTKEQRKSSDGFDILSMGMSSDYVTAIKNGSNIVRIGSALFGARV